MDNTIGVNYDLSSAQFPVLAADEENVYEKYNLNNDFRMKFKPESKFEYTGNKYFRVRATTNGKSAVANDNWVKCGSYWCLEKPKGPVAMSPDK